MDITRLYVETWDVSQHPGRIKAFEMRETMVFDEPLYARRLYDCAER